MKNTINSHLNITGDRVLIVGFWGNKNMGDELILLGTVRLLLKQGKQIFIVSQNNGFLKKFLGQFLSNDQIKGIIFMNELPRGVRGLFKYIFTKKIFDIKTFFKIDTIILGGGEILTEESPSSYYYRLWSIWPAIILKKTLYIMGGIQIPTKRFNKFLFNLILKNTRAIYARDNKVVEDLQKFGYKNIEFFMDTSYFAIDDWKEYKVDPDKGKENYLVVNINSNGKQFLDEIIKDIKDYLKNNSGKIRIDKIYYVPICFGKDNDLKYFGEIKARFISGTYVKNIDILPRDKDFKSFLNVLGGAKIVFGTRLHLYLISQFIGVETKTYPYQKKITKMKKTLETIF